LDKGSGISLFCDQGFLSGTDLMDSWGTLRPLRVERLRTWFGWAKTILPESGQTIAYHLDSAAVIKGFAARLCLSDVASRRHGFV